jgi:hypothetical protein
MGSEGGGYRKTVQRSVGTPCQREGAHWQLPAGLLAIESGHENEGTWPLRETPLESVQTFRGKGHLLAQGQTADQGVGKKREVKNVSVFGLGVIVTDVTEA